MARQRRIEQAPIIPSNALVASAVQYPAKIDRAWYPTQQSWQIEAWRQYDLCPELRFAANWIGNALSRVTLGPGKVGDDGKIVRDDNTQISELLNLLFGGSDGQAAMLRSLGIHLTVAGEAYIIGRKAKGGDIWEVIGSNELKVQGANWSIDYGSPTRPIPLADNDVIIRIWQPHPVKRIYADSSIRPLLTVLTEIEMLSRHIHAQSSSRLAGSGIFALPQSVQFPAAPSGELPEGVSDNTADQFMRMLSDAMITPLKDPGSAASVVPIVITVPDETLDKIKEPIHFWSPFDAAVGDARTRAVERFALGMDMPPEIVLGMSGQGRSSSGGTSHWTSWQIEESAIKLHIEPLVELITSGLTMQYIRPITKDGSAAISYDTTVLRLQPDRSKESIELYDRGELTGDSLRKHNGFGDGDKPDDTERKDALIRKVAGGSATPEQVGAALEILGVHLPMPEIPVDQGTTTREARPTPSLEGHPSRAIPDTRSALHAACNVLVYRALERAGNRLRAAKPQAAPQCKAAETYLYVTDDPERLLRDAWSCVPEAVAGLADADKVTSALNSYVHTLIEGRQKHDPTLMQHYLALVD